MKGAAKQMLTDTPTTTEPAFSVSNFKISDEDLPEFRDMKFEDINELHLDHPGANDPAYRKRRDYIASLAKKFRETGEITDVDYNDEEQGIWRHVATRLEELHEKYASPFYLKSKTRSRHLDRANTAALGNEPEAERADRLSPRTDRGPCRDTRFPVVAVVPRDALDPIHSPSFAARLHARARHRPRIDRPHSGLHKSGLCRLFAIRRPRRAYRER